jgi:lipoprotein-anchoring transpeptidase ErfK/SrfK
MRGARAAIRRLVFVAVVSGLLAAVPLSAVASENILSGDVRQAQASFSQSLADAVRGGFDRSQADDLMWRFSQVSAIESSSWWQAPIVEHSKLDKLNQLQADLDSQLAQQIADNRDALLRQLHRWNQTLADAEKIGYASEGSEATTTRVTTYAASATTPNELSALATVLSEQYAILDGRMAAFRTAREQVTAALQNATTLLASAGQYSQLNLAGFKSQIDAANSAIGSVHSVEGWTPLLAQLQQTASGLQGLLNARSAAFNQLADTRSTLASARSIGALVGSSPAKIDALAGQLQAASDQPAFQSITSQLYQQKQVLAAAIYMKQMSPVAYSAGAGKLIVVSLSRQVLTAFQDGAAVMTTFVATGRPALPTPTGVYHIFHRYSPYKMISPWPYGSPYWYPDSWTNWAMEFAGGGYFIHDAPWRSWYGPGSNIYNGTHGCVNVPYSQMAFLWGWAPIGTTVVIQY